MSTPTTTDDAPALAAEVAPAIGAIGAAYYFVPDTIATAKAHGLDGFRMYFLGRGGVLGDVESQVVASAFGYFAPDLVDKMWTTAKQVMAPREAARLYLGCAHEFARARLADVEGLAAFNEAAAAVNDAVDPAGLALYAGVDAEPVPTDEPARALHLTTVLREARGSTHLVALVASGLPPRLAHRIKRPTEDALFGWRDEPEITDDHRRRWAAAEALTDALMAPAFAVLDGAGRTALRAGLQKIGAALQG